MSQFLKATRIRHYFSTSGDGCSGDPFRFYNSFSSQKLLLVDACELIMNEVKDVTWLEARKCESKVNENNNNCIREARLSLAGRMKKRERRQLLLSLLASVSVSISISLHPYLSLSLRLCLFVSISSVAPRKVCEPRKTSPEPVRCNTRDSIHKPTADPQDGFGEEPQALIRASFYRQQQERGECFQPGKHPTGVLLWLF